MYGISSYQEYITLVLLMHIGAHLPLLTSIGAPSAPNEHCLLLMSTRACVLQTLGLSCSVNRFNVI